MPLERQVESFSMLKSIIDNNYNFSDRDVAREFFTKLTSLYKNWNYTPLGTPEYDRYRQDIASLVEQNEGRPERRASDREAPRG
jgi:V/A-type H+-transporting ATPase subunit A